MSHKTEFPRQSEILTPSLQSPGLGEEAPRTLLEPWGCPGKPGVGRPSEKWPLCSDRLGAGLAEGGG